MANSAQAKNVRAKTLKRVNTTQACVLWFVLTSNVLLSAIAGGDYAVATEAYKKLFL